MGVISAALKKLILHSLPGQTCTQVFFFNSGGSTVNSMSLCAHGVSEGLRPSEPQPPQKLENFFIIIPLSNLTQTSKAPLTLDDTVPCQYCNRINYAFIDSVRRRWAKQKISSFNL